MLFLHSTGRRWALLFLLVSSLGACQRAAFQFQPGASTPYSAVVSLQKQAADELPAAPRSRMATLVPAARAQTRRVRLPQHLGQTATASRRLVRFAEAHRAAAAAATASVATGLPPQQPGPAIEPERRRSRVIAILLAALSITYLPLSLHNFYLGYYGRGALAIFLLLAGTLLLLLGFPDFLFGGSLTAIGYIGIAVLGGWFFWQLSDLLRIITRDLQPKNGSYRKKSA